MAIASHRSIAGSVTPTRQSVNEMLDLDAERRRSSMHSTYNVHSRWVPTARGSRPTFPHRTEYFPTSKSLVDCCTSFDDLSENDIARAVFEQSQSTARFDRLSLNRFRLGSDYFDEEALADEREPRLGSPASPGAQHSIDLRHSYRIFLKRFHKSFWLVMTLIGICMAFTSVASDLVVLTLISIRAKIVKFENWLVFGRFVQISLGFSDDDDDFVPPPTDELDIAGPLVADSRMLGQETIENAVDNYETHPLIEGFDYMSSPFGRQSVGTSRMPSIRTIRIDDSASKSFFDAEFPLDTMLFQDVSHIDLQNPQNLLLWVISAIALTLLAHACVHFAPCAAGSGLPEIKSLITGQDVAADALGGKDFLNIRTFFWKFVGLTFALGAGLPIGKLGPYVHMSCCLAVGICHSNIFPKKVRKRFRRFTSTATDRTKLMTAAIGAGVCATFGAPVGALMFSIEIATTFFFIANIWRAFFCSILCLLSLRLLGALNMTRAFAETELPDPALKELPCFILLGILGGVLGVALIWGTKSCMILSRYLKGKGKPYMVTYICIISGLVGLATSVSPSVAQLDKAIINSMFSTKPLIDDIQVLPSKAKPIPDATPSASATNRLFNQSSSAAPTTPMSFLSEHNYRGVVSFYHSRRTGQQNAFKSDISMCLYVIFLKTIGLAFALSLPIPAGVFTPVFVLGAAFGRCFGLLIGADEPAVYAVVGAACITAGVTRSIAVIIIVFELTGQSTHMAPMLCAVCACYTIMSPLSPPIFDVMIHLNELRFLPHLRHPKAYRNYVAEDLAFSIPPECCVYGPKFTRRDISNAVAGAKKCDWFYSSEVNAMNNLVNQRGSFAGDLVREPSRATNSIASDEFTSIIRPVDGDSRSVALLQGAGGTGADGTGGETEGRADSSPSDENGADSLSHLLPLPIVLPLREQHYHTPTSAHRDNGHGFDVQVFEASPIWKRAVTPDAAPMGGGKVPRFQDNPESQTLPSNSMIDAFNETGVPPKEKHPETDSTVPTDVEDTTFERVHSTSNAIEVQVGSDREVAVFPKEQQFGTTPSLAIAGNQHGLPNEPFFNNFPRATTSAVSKSASCATPAAKNSASYATCSAASVCGRPDSEVKLLGLYYADDNLVDDAPLTVPRKMSLARVHFLFIMLSVRAVFVTDPAEDNRIVGVITRSSFFQAFEGN